VPAGSNTQVQFNDGGAFGGDAGLTYDKASDALTVSGAILNASGSEAAPSYSFSGFTGDGMWRGAAGALNLSLAGARIFFINATSLTLPMTSTVAWASSAAFGAADLRLARESAGVLQINNGTVGDYRDLKLRRALVAPTTLGTIVDGALEYDASKLWFTIGATRHKLAPSSATRLYNVKDYGATGDGLTNDTTAIQAAFTAAQTMATTAPGGVSIYFPGGRYLITSALTIVANQISIYGDGPASMIYFGDATTNGIVVGDGTTSCSNITVRNLLFFNNLTRTAGSALLLRKCLGLYVSAVSFGSQFTSIYLENCTKAVVFGFIILETATNGTAIAVTGTSSADTEIASGVVTNISYTATNNGIVVNHASTLAISNVVFGRFLYGIRLLPGAGNTVNNVTVAQCTINECGTGASLELSSADPLVRILNTLFQSCTFASNGVGIAQVKGGSGLARGVAVDACAVLSSLNQGVYFNDPTCNEVQVTNNQIAGNGVTTANTYDGVYLNSGSNLRVCNNTIGRWNNLTGQQRYGLSIGGTNFITVTGNDAIGNVTGSFFNAATGINQRWMGNTTNDSTALAAAATLTIPPWVERWVSVSGSVNITNITASWDQRQITLISTSAGFSVVDGGNLIIAGNWAATGTFSTLTLISNGSSWFELSRSAN